MNGCGRPVRRWPAPTVVEWWGRRRAAVHDLDRGHLAWSDCERVRPGFIAQPVNTWSSLAYCVAGAWIIARGPVSYTHLTLPTIYSV